MFSHLDEKILKTPPPYLRLCDEMFILSNMVMHSWYEGYKNSNSKSTKMPKFSISSFKHTLQGLQRLYNVGKVSSLIEKRLFSGF